MLSFQVWFPLGIIQNAFLSSLIPFGEVVFRKS
jgi:hypothetical protein